MTIESTISNFPELSFEDVLKVLSIPNEPLSLHYLNLLSDIDSAQLDEIQKIWPDIPDQRRLEIISEVELVSKSNYLLSFQTLCQFIMNDHLSHVREVAIRALWEYEDKSLITKFLDLLETDPDVDVRAASTTALGRYVYLGEIEKIPPETLNLIVDRLRDLASGSGATIVKRRALESLGYSGNSAVPGLIDDAYRSGKDDFVCSALVAMGRSANPRWTPIVLNELTSDSPEVCLEAIKAAGELELQEGTETLINYLDDEDSDIRMAAIWALSNIGGKGIAEVLEDLLEDTEDDIEAELITEALDNLVFADDIDLFPLFELGDDDGDDEQLNQDLLDHTADEDTIH